jgi:parallel beta-helix repeat protein
MAGKNNTTRLVLGLIIIIVVIVAAMAIYNSGHRSIQTPLATTTAITVSYQSGPVYVNATANEVNATGSPSDPFKTINQALAFAKPGAVIMVAPGVYTGSLNITHGVMIEGTDANTTILNASDQMNGIDVIGPGANGTIISNLTIENADNHGIYVQDSSNVVLIHNRVIHNGVDATLCPQPPAKPTGPCIIEDKPIELIGTENVIVENNLVVNNLADGGIGVSDMGYVNPGSLAQTNIFAKSSNNKIINNTVTNNKGGCGIVISSYNKDGVINNIVENNKVSFGVAGIVIGDGAPNSTALDNIIENNTAIDNFLPGIIIHATTPGDTLSNTIVEFNKVSGNGNDTEVGDLNKTGILVSGDVVPVYNTTIAENNVSNEYYGIWIRNGVGINLHGNSFANVTASNYTK